MKLYERFDPDDPKRFPADVSFGQDKDYCLRLKEIIYESGE